MGSRKTMLLAAIGGSFLALTVGPLAALQPALSTGDYYAGMDDEAQGDVAQQTAAMDESDDDDSVPGYEASTTSFGTSTIGTGATGSNTGATCTNGSAPCFTCPSPCGCATPCSSFCQMVGKSLFSDVYAQPSQWRPMTLGTLFSEGWNESWISPVNGSGGAPRQGWINAQDGVFYRLTFTGFTAQQNLAGGGNGYAGYTTVFAPINRRFEVRIDVPWVASNPVPAGGYHTNFGNLTIYPRVLLHETQDTSVVLEMPVRCGTGSTANGNGYSSVGPNVSFWRNTRNGWVVRGGVGTTIPTGVPNNLGVRTTADAFFAIGNYITPHDALPFGDFVYYLSTNVHTPIDNRSGISYTYCSLTPGFRCHMGDNWYALGGLEVPVVHPVPFQYAPTTWLMKVF